MIATPRRLGHYYEPGTGLSKPPVIQRFLCRWCVLQKEFAQNRERENVRPSRVS